MHKLGFGTTTPEDASDVVSTYSGVIVPRVANTAAITTPINGMMIYDLSTNCLKAYQNGAWSDCVIEKYVSSVPSVTGAGGGIWMDRNLGATQVATSSTDAASYGDLYQWGRGTDGHELRTSNTTTTISTTDLPGHGDFITEVSNPNDWRSPQNDNLWQGVNGINNPCPRRYRLLQQQS